MVTVAQLVEASGCEPESCGFESHRSPLIVTGRRLLVINMKNTLGEQCSTPGCPERGSNGNPYPSPWGAHNLKQESGSAPDEDKGWVGEGRLPGHG